MSATETLEQIRALLVTSPHFRTALIDLLVQAGMYHSRQQKIYYRAEVGAKMLAVGERRSGAQSMLRERFAISRSTAYRDLERSINLRQGSLFDD